VGFWYLLYRCEKGKKCLVVVLDLWENLLKYSDLCNKIGNWSRFKGSAAAANVPDLGDPGPHLRDNFRLSGRNQAIFRPGCTFIHYLSSAIYWGRPRSPGLEMHFTAVFGLFLGCFWNRPNRSYDRANRVKIAPFSPLPACLWVWNPTVPILEAQKGCWTGQNHKKITFLKGKR
jgi:hypothetical protein